MMSSCTNRSMILSLFLVLLIAFSGCKGKIIIPAGQLAEHLNETEGENVYIYKKDGTLSERPNDLEELWKDWNFYSEKIGGEIKKAGGILEAAKSPNENIEEYMEKQDRINAWMDEYDKRDVMAMCRHLKLCAG